MTNPASPHSNPPTVSVAVLTLDAGSGFAETLEVLRLQEPAAMELVVVDSGSTDGTDRRAAAAGAAVHRITTADFDFGRTRDLVYSLCRGELIATLSQDVIPKDRFWLSRLTAPFVDPEVAYASARCEAREPETMFLWQRLGRFYFTREMARFTTRFGVPCSNANACVRRTVWDQLRHGDMPIAEDLLFQQKVLAAGHRVAQIPEPIAWHQHAYSLSEVTRRAFNEGVATRRLGIDYSWLDAVKDGLRPDLALTLLRQIRYRRVRDLATLLYPWLRPLAVYAGGRFGRGYWR